MKKKLLGQERLKQLFYSLCFILLGTTLCWGQQTVVPYVTSGTWECPVGVTSVTVECWGGGGAGGSATGGTTRGGGGGGGGSYVTNTIAVVPGTTYTITVGVGGAKGGTTSTAPQGFPGGKSEFSGGVVTTITASGGTGGSGGTPIQARGFGGVLGGVYGYTISGTGTGYVNSSTVTVNGNGNTNMTATGKSSGTGTIAYISTTNMGSGYTSVDSVTLLTGSGQTATALFNPNINAGGTPTEGTNGTNATTTFGGGGGAGGNGGAATADVTTATGSVGATGNFPGGGGSGGFAGSATTARQGGAGGAGQVILTYTPTTPTISISTSTLSGFNYDAGTGPSSNQTFTVSGASLDANITVTPPVNYEVSIDNSTWITNPSTLGLTQTGGALDGSPVTVYARLKTGLTSGNYNGETISLTSTGATPASVTCSGGVTGIFYYSGSGSLATTSNWGTAIDGSGANPANFTDNFQRFIIRNTTAHTTDAAWAVSGTNSKIIVGDATQAGLTLTIASTFPTTGTMDITAASSGVNSVIVQDNTQPTFGLLDDNSEVHYQIAASITGAYTYGKLFIDGTGSANISSAPVVKTAMTVAAGKTLNMYPNSAFYVTINPGGTVQIDGTVIVQKPEGLVDAVISASSSKGSFQFLGTDNLTLGANSVINYGRNLTGTQTISPRDYVNLTISGASGSKSIGAATSVSNKLTITGNSVLNTGGLLTLKSNATKTAVVAPVVGTISGNVTVERFIPTGQRAYRFLSSPVTTATFIDTNWQAGTHITGAGGVANGFDATTGNNPSMFTYTNTTPAWNAVTNTNATVLTSGVPYLTYLRGSRSASLTTAQTGVSVASDATTLSATGTLTTGNVIVSGLNETADGFSAVGNPYQAQVDMQAVLAAATNLNTGFYYVVDPSLGTKGAYLAVDVTAAATAHISQYLQPGQACFVKTLAAGPASLTFAETNKSEAAAQTTIFRTRNNTTPSLDITLYNGTMNRLDALKVAFDASESNEVNQNDATKLNNFDESLATSNSGKLLAIEKRAVPTAADEIPLSITKYRGISYSLKLQGAGLTETPYLVDNFTGTTTEIPVDGTVDYAYTVDAGNAATIDASRFKLVYAKTLKTNDNAVAGFTLYPNPSKSNSFNVVVPQSMTKASLTVSNLLGQQLYSQNDLQAGATTKVNVSNVKTAGVYLVRLTSEGKTATTKWIVE